MIRLLSLLILLFFSTSSFSQMPKPSIEKTQNNLEKPKAKAKTLQDSRQKNQLKWIEKEQLWINGKENTYYKVKFANKKWGVVDKMGKTIISVIYDELWGMDVDKPYIKFKQGDKFGIVNLNNNIVAKAIYDCIGGLNKYNQIIVCINEKYGLINANGETVIECIYGDIAPMRNDGYYVVNIGGQRNSYNYSGKFGIVDFNGKIIKKIEYDYLPEISYYDKDEVIPFKKSGLWGFMDYSFTEQTYLFGDFKYTRDFNKIEYFAKWNDKWGAFDKKGNKVFENIYDEIYGESSYSMGNRHIIAKKNGFYGLITDKLEVVLPFIYDYISDRENGYYRLAIYKSKYGYISSKPSLKKDIPFIYENGKDFGFYDFGFGTEVEKNGKKIFLNENGECIKNCN